jgi:hypothetical protein
MTSNHKVNLRMFDVQNFVDQPMVEDLDHLDKQILWYEGSNPLPHLQELAKHQFQQRLEVAAFPQYTINGFDLFRLE